MRNFMEHKSPKRLSDLAAFVILLLTGEVCHKDIRFKIDTIGTNIEKYIDKRLIIATPCCVSGFYHYYDEDGHTDEFSYDFISFKAFKSLISHYKHDIIQ